MKTLYVIDRIDVEHVFSAFVCFKLVQKCENRRDVKVVLGSHGLHRSLTVPTYCRYLSSILGQYQIILLAMNNLPRVIT